MTRSSLLVLLPALLLVLSPLAPAKESSWSQIARGRYLVRVGDCDACHTPEGGQYLAGGKAVPTPFGTVYSANITPDKVTGIGAWNRDQFIRAFRKGLDAEGHNLYPAFPYPSFTKVRTEDIIAIWTYLNSIIAVRNPVRSPDLQWPLGWRQLMSVWKGHYFKPGVYQPDPDKSAVWNQGAYLVQGLGHCGSCHTPRNALGAADEEHPLAGYRLQGWYASNLTGNRKTGLGDWSRDDIVTYLHTGAQGDHIAAGLMREVIEKSTQHMKPSDLYAIATYLKDLPGSEQESGSGESGKGSQPADRDQDSDPGQHPGMARDQVAGEPAQTQKEADSADANADQMAKASAATADNGQRRAGGKRQGSEQSPSRGRMLYVDNCTGCHGFDGDGIRKTFPGLGHSPIVQAEDPASLIHVVLRGSQEPSTVPRPNNLAMPGFAWKFTDEQVAELLTYIRQAWGNDAGAVDSGEVQTLRHQTQLSRE